MKNKYIEEKKTIIASMKNLINLYESVDNIDPESTQLLVKDFISRKEKELVAYLNNKEKGAIY